MAAKSLPIVGEAFLGSDPLVVKVVRITFGSTGFSGTNDVNLTSAGAQNLLTFADTTFKIVDVMVNISELFSVGAINLGVDSDIDALGGDTGAFGIDFTAAAWYSVKRGLSTGVVAGYAATDDLLFGGVWPATSDATIQVSYSGAAAMGTEGHAEVYVFYITAEVR